MWGCRFKNYLAQTLVYIKEVARYLNLKMLNHVLNVIKGREVT